QGGARRQGGQEAAEGEAGRCREAGRGPPQAARGERGGVPWLIARTLAAARPGRDGLAQGRRPGYDEVAAGVQEPLCFVVFGACVAGDRATTGRPRRV
ncbi:unnamed protein product, partial [Prorocentrum cordatum]